MRKAMSVAPESVPATSTCRAPIQRMTTAIAVPSVSVIGWASAATRVTRTIPRA
jgi:hypothetical protein